MKFRFNLKTFCVFILILVAEIIIALYVRDTFIRPYGGDILVVILMYYFVKSFIKTKSLYLAVGVLLFAYLIEIAQYFNMVEVLGVQNNKLLVVVLGSSFSWVDMLAYTVGASICYFIDRNR